MAPTTGFTACRLAIVQWNTQQSAETNPSQPPIETHVPKGDWITTRRAEHPAVRAWSTLGFPAAEPGAIAILARRRWSAARLRIVEPPWPPSRPPCAKMNEGEALGT